MMEKPQALWALVLGLMLAVTGCGSDGNNGSAGTGGSGRIRWHRRICGFRGRRRNWGLGGHRCCNQLVRGVLRGHVRIRATQSCR